VASLSQGRTAAAQCGLFTHKSVPVIFEPPCIRKDPDIHLPFSVSARYWICNNYVCLGQFYYKCVSRSLAVLL